MERIAGINAIPNKVLVPGVVLRACAALRRLVGLTSQTDVMVHLVVKLGMNAS